MIFIYVIVFAQFLQTASHFFIFIFTATHSLINFNFQKKVRGLGHGPLSHTAKSVSNLLVFKKAVLEVMHHNMPCVKSFHNNNFQMYSMDIVINR